MKREWKPGDVAALENHGGRAAVRVAADCGAKGHDYCKTEHWHYLAALGGATWDSNPDREARPLVVIDPEDREQVERLYQSILRVYGRQKITDVAENQALMQAALREFANPTPPKPEEPTGLGAVVATEADGDFIRVSSELQNPWLNVQTGVVHSWLRVAAVRVLSEGVAS